MDHVQDVLLETLVFLDLADDLGEVPVFLLPGAEVAVGGVGLRLHPAELVVEV